MTATGLVSRIGRFELALLKAIHTTGEDAYCVRLAEHLSAMQQREVSFGQVSRTLGVLKGIGMVESREVQPMPPRKNARRRIVYTITEDGMAIAKDAIGNPQSNQSIENLAPPPSKTVDRSTR